MIAVVGVSHHQTPIAVREELALDEAGTEAFLKRLSGESVVREAMLLSTCNRVEVFAAGSTSDPEVLSEVARVSERALLERSRAAGPYVFRHVGGQAVRHVFRVASSLDSLVLGEPQILGQLKQAFDQACKAGTVGSVLYQAVPRALRVAKKVRSQTAIGSGQVSVPTVAVDLTLQIFGSLRGKTALLVGSGEMGCSVAKLLRGAGVRLIVLGRTAANVQALAEEVGGEARLMNDLTASLVEADVVITSTSAPGHVITEEMVQAGRRSRRGRNLFFIDLAVPRDVAPSTGDVDGVFLYNIDDFSKLVAESRETRQREAEAAEALVQAAVAGYERWLEGEQVTPVVKALRARFTQVLDEELERSLRGKLKGLGEAERAALRRMTESAVNKLMHEPTVRLRASAQDSASEALPLEATIEALSAVFDLQSSPSPAAEALPLPPDEAAALVPDSQEG